MPMMINGLSNMMSVNPTSDHLHPATSRITLFLIYGNSKKTLKKHPIRNGMFSYMRYYKNLSKEDDFQSPIFTRIKNGGGGGIRTPAGR